MAVNSRPGGSRRRVRAAVGPAIRRDGVSSLAGQFRVGASAFPVARPGDAGGTGRRAIVRSVEPLTCG